jgi:hypothetical protein
MTLTQATRHALPWPTLRPYQAEAWRAILRSVRGNEGGSISVMMARQAGKNELSAQIEGLLLALNARRAVDSIKCAPTFQPQAKISLRRLWTRLQEADLSPILTKEDGYIVRLGQARQVFLSAEPNSNVIGHTAHLLLEADEAQDLDAEKFDREFRPMAAANNATTVYYGTAWDNQTLLEQVKQQHLESERRDGCRRHFECDWQEVARFNPAYGQFVEAERQRLGENHPLFLTQYCLRTVSSGGFLNAGQRAQLQGDHSRLQAAVAGEVYVAGLDIGGQDLSSPSPGEEGRGKEEGLDRPLTTSLSDGVATVGGHDATVLTIVRVVHPASFAPLQDPRLEIVEHRAWSGIGHDELLITLADLLGRLWRIRRVAIDATGLGETMARFLTRALRGGVVIPFHFTTETKSRLGYELLAAVNTGRLKMYVGDGSLEYREFWREVDLARVAYRPNRTMNFYVDPARGHDDYLMSLVLAVAAAKDAHPRAAQGRLRDDSN